MTIVSRVTNWIHIKYLMVLTHLMPAYNSSKHIYIVINVFLYSQGSYVFPDSSGLSDDSQSGASHLWPTMIPPRYSPPHNLPDEKPPPYSP